MSEVLLGQDKKGKDVKMSYGALYKGDRELQAKFYRFVDWYNSYDENSAPRHGIFSILSRRTNCYIYDHPALKGLCQTAFTTGDAIFFDKDFFQTLLDHRTIPNTENKPYNTLEFVYSHELNHIMKMHFSRLKYYSGEESNIIGDMNINLELLRTFPNWHYPSGWGDKFIGFREVDMDDYAHLSEESIARKMMIRRDEILKRDGIDPDEAKKHEKMRALHEVIGWEVDKNTNTSDNGDENQTSKSPSEPDAENTGDGKPSGASDDADDESTDENKGGGKGKPGESDDDADENGKDPHDEHMITNEELADALIQAGDKELADALGISPDMTDEEKAKAIQDAKDKLTKDLAEAQNERKRAQNRGLALPGGHVEDALDDSLKIDREPKLDWKLLTQGMIYGEGMEVISEDSVIHDMYHIDPSLMGLPDHVFIPGNILYEETKGCYLFIIDTSASMTLDMIEESVAEIKGVLEGIDNDETKVFLVSADTVSRGDVLEINASNIEEKFEELILYGRGGTNLTAGIVDSMELVEEKFPDYPISGIIYGTDLGDMPPKREDLPDNLPELIFITAPQEYNTHFAASVSDYAKVVSIESGNEAAFDNEFDGMSM